MTTVPERERRFSAGRLVVLASVIVVALAAVSYPAWSAQVPDLHAHPELAGHPLMAVAVFLAFTGEGAYLQGYLAGVWLVSALGP